MSSNGSRHQREVGDHWDGAPAVVLLPIAILHRVSQHTR